MATKKILCTGGAGYIGSHTTLSLFGTGRYECVVVDDYSNASGNIQAVVEKAVGHPVKFVTVDLCDRKAVEELFAKEKFDAVIHYAAKKAVGESVEKPLEYYDNNLNSLINILFAMKNSGCKRLVFSSSACVYAPKETPICEADPLGAPNPYGSTKVVGERILSDCCVADKDLRVISLRYFNPIGNIADGSMGEDPKVAFNLLPNIMRTAVGTLESVKVFGNDWPTRDGTGVRDYIHVLDLADGHVAALDSLFEKADTYRVYNLGSSIGVSVLEMIQEFEKASGKKVKYEIHPRRPGDLGCVVADCSKARDELKWKPTRTTFDACLSAYKWQSSHPKGFRD